MAQPATQLFKEYSGFENVIVGIVRNHWLELADNQDIENRLQTIEQTKNLDETRWARLEQRLENIENNLMLYREDSKHFQDELKTDYVAFRKEMKEENEAFRKEMKEEMDKRFEQVDKHFEQIESRFERLDYQLMDIHKAITRMSVFFVTGIALIGTILTIVDKLWQP